MPPFGLFAAITTGVATLGAAAAWFWIYRGGELTFDVASVFCF
jgi:hypothetical protein